MRYLLVLHHVREIIVTPKSHYPCIATARRAHVPIALAGHGFLVSAGKQPRPMGIPRGGSADYNDFGSAGERLAAWTFMAV